MKIIQFDSIGGASGDMILAALINLGVSRDELQTQLSSLPLPPFQIQAERVTQNGMAGTRVTIAGGDEPHGHVHPAPHLPHRGLADITSLISESRLPPAVRRMSIAVFEKLAAAEATVHQTTPDRIHFHEVGAVDSIVDIVGACLALDCLHPDAVAVGPLPLGHGVIECAHGMLPSPAPATIELLKGFAVEQTDEPFELVTPTGAVLLTHWKTLDRPPPGSRLLHCGHGFGQRRLNRRPNLLRAFLLESPVAAPDQDNCLVLECQVDDTVPELMGTLLRKLMDNDALDAYLTPVQMKKNRPGTLLTVLCRPEQQDVLADLIFRETTTFGIRLTPSRRIILERRFESAETPYGAVRIKVGRWQGGDVTFAPEHEDCVRLAEAAGVPVRAVYEAAVRMANRSA